ncbi:carbohydrate-selective porin B [Acetobacter indonesiensis NRIC 0313]|uniref:Porin n=1 Tax=Acetobacter indonesiensis TaxID=104101 RepID=A0A6N3T2Z5_9PROT|nr:carbohydrate porin [Acetobacter indonesiensis]GAN62276.1 porin B carbohydrate-selective OprB [Acetobacter indonesiensis]GBQ60386.1 carbohydrate-selective porin B [Acetobacter indonesiensis NRIC 0313]GEN02244.1 porin [Acetobacter indonesiensis]
MTQTSSGPFSFRTLSLTCLLVSAFSAQAHAQLLTGGNSAVGLWPSLEANNEANPVEDPGPLFSAPYGHNHFFGDWWGAQPWLLDHGIHILADVHEELAGNFKGGRKQGVTNAGQVGVELDVDWGKLTNADFMKGFWSHMMVVNGHGRNLSTDYIGDSIGGVQQIYGARGNVVAHLVYLYGEKSFLNNHVDVSAGWIPVGSFFAASPLFCMYMNVAVCGNPAPNKYTEGNRDWPSGNLGAVVRVMPTNETYIMGGLFAVSPHAYNGGISGWAWAQDGLGKFSTPVEVGWLPSFGKNHLVGHYKAGYSYDNSKYKDLYEDINGNPWVLTGQPARYHAGRASAWIIADQMLMRNGEGPINGLIAHAGYMWTDGKTTAMSHHIWGGFIETGEPWGRPLDSIGVMYQWLKMSRTVALQQEASIFGGQPFQSNQWGQVWGVQSHENIYELFYNAHVANGLTLQPDFQYINRPGGTTTFHDAAVMALQFNVVL